MYYEKHSWPKLAVLLLSGVACLVVGLLRKRGTPNVKKPAGNDLDASIESLQEPAFDGSRDHLFYIPLQYWSIAYFAAAIIYLVKVYLSDMTSLRTLRNISELQIANAVCSLALSHAYQRYVLCNRG